MAISAEARSQLITEIETAVSARETDRAKLLIQRYLRSHKNSGDFLDETFRACEWYRRLGLYREAFKISSKEFKGRGTARGPRHSELVLWNARLLNYLGMSAFAAEFARKAEPKTAREHQHLAEIYLSAGEREEAIRHFGAAVEIEKHLLTREARICRFGLADALSAAGRCEEAIQLILPEIRKTQEPVALAVIYSCIGEYEARRENYEAAENWLVQAEKQMPALDRTVDRAILCQWSGITRFHLGRKKEGLALIDEAEAIYRELGLRVDALFEVRLRRHALVPLNEIELEQIRRFPGISPVVKRKLPPPSRPSITEPSHAPILIDLSADEYRVAESGKEIQAHWRLGIPLDLRLLANLRLAGEIGLSRLWCIGLLWPHDALALLQLEPRLDQIILRLRREYGVKIDTDATRTALSSDDFGRIEVCFDSEPKPRLLRETASPSAAQITAFYRVTRAQAYRYLAHWRESGFIPRS